MKITKDSIYNQFQKGLKNWQFLLAILISIFVPLFEHLDMINFGFFKHFIFIIPFFTLLLFLEALYEEAKINRFTFMTFWKGAILSIAPLVFIGLTNSLYSLNQYSQVKFFVLIPLVIIVGMMRFVSASLAFEQKRGWEKASIVSNYIYSFLIVLYSFALS